MVISGVCSKSLNCVSLQAVDGVRRSQSSDVLTEAEEVSAFLLELGHFFHEWRFTLPDVLILLQVNADLLKKNLELFLLFLDLNTVPTSYQFSFWIVRTQCAS